MQRAAQAQKAFLQLPFLLYTRALNSFVQEFDTVRCDGHSLHRGGVLGRAECP